MPNEREREIKEVKKAQQNLQNFSSLYEKYFDKVYKYFFFRLQAHMESEELTSITFEKTLLNLSKFKDQGYSFATWLFRIAHNTLIDYYRQNNKKTIPLDELTPDSEPRTNHIPEFVEKIDANDNIRKIREIIDTLPVLQQEIWAMKLNSELSHKHIAEILNITENYVNVTLHRSIKVIKKQLLR